MHVQNLKRELNNFECPGYPQMKQNADGRRNALPHLVFLIDAEHLRLRLLILTATTCAKTVVEGLRHQQHDSQSQVQVHLPNDVRRWFRLHSQRVNTLQQARLFLLQPQTFPLFELLEGTVLWDRVVDDPVVRVVQTHRLNPVCSSHLIIGLPVAV